VRATIRADITVHVHSLEVNVSRLVRVIIVVAFVGGTAALATGQSAGDALDPARVASDTHTIAFENAFVRILDVRVPAGKIEPRHRHPHGLSVYFTDWDAKVTVDGRAPQVNQRKAGTFAWSDAVIHTVENVGKNDGQILRIELKH
jgi:quercetin dioxygenase-like cupin family protein